MFDAIVLAGGSSTRFGGRDKASIEINGTSLLERALRATAGAETIVVVGPARAVDRDVVWAMENPSGTGPAAAIGAGLEYVASDVVVVLAVDMPLMSPAAVDRLLASLDGHDGACFVDEHDRVQHLAAVYRCEPLRKAAARDLRGSSVKALFERLDVNGVFDERACMDCDTPGDVSRIAAVEGSRMLRKE